MVDSAEREKQITRTSLTGVGANIFLAAFKALAGTLSGSLAILLDAVNNLTDALSSVITIAGVLIAKRKPDTKHPFGHGRIEYISAVVIAAIITSAGGVSLFESVKKILHPDKPEYTVLTLVIIAVAVVTKLLLGWYVKGKGRKYNSDALVASGSDASFDAIISASTLVGALITMIFDISLDGIIGAVIAVFIIKAGMEMLLDSLGDIMGSRPDSETTIAIKKRIKSFDSVLGAYDLILHNYGPNNAIGSVHIEIPSTMTAEELHNLTKDIQLAIRQEFNVFMTVGIYAVDSQHQALRESIYHMATAHPGVLGTHGVYINDAKKYISFDAMTDFTVNDKPALAEQLKKEVNELLPGYTVDLRFDVNFSD